MLAAKTNKTLGLVLVFALIAACPTGAFAQQSEQNYSQEELLDMSLEELMEVEIESTASLTKTTKRLVPAAVTTVTKDDIAASGARSLFELLDIYIPNLQWIRHHWEGDHMGLRGIINDRDDKYLLLVNGRVMNERTHFGAVSERDLVLLQDIHHIDVVRGPGSAMYGPGAIAMVINIITDNASTFEGTEVTSRLGAVEEFYSGEFKHGQKFDDAEGGVFLYAGIAKYLGADQYDAPQIFATDFPDDAYLSWDLTDTGPELPWEDTEAGEPFTSLGINRDGETHRNLPPLKLHAQITRDNWDIWGRYTRGGQQFAWDIGPLAHYPMGWGNWNPSPEQQSSGYQQATAYAGYKQELSEDASIDYAFSYDMFDFERYQSNTVSNAHREDEYYGKVMLNWDMDPQHKLAFGGEISHEEFGLPSPGWPVGYDTGWNDAFAVVDPCTGEMPRWSTNLFSLVGEYQWNINDKWTTFIGARYDDHTYTSDMFSPRGTLVYTPNKKDTIKAMLARSVRMNFAEQSKVNDMLGRGETDPEVLDNTELRYERQQDEHLSLAGSIFYQDLDAITIPRDQLVGTQKQWGLEFEASYRTEKTRLNVSHGYVKLIGFELEDPTTGTMLVTAEPYGYGCDLANWSNHITKLTAQHKLSDKWTLDGSLRIYWGFPGRKDYDHYRPSPITDSAIEPGWEKAYRANMYLNLGLQYRPTDDLTIGFNGYNLLGIFNKDFNKRNYYDGYGDYRSHAPAVGVSLKYKF